MICPKCGSPEQVYSLCDSPDFECGSFISEGKGLTESNSCKLIKTQRDRIAELERDIHKIIIDHNGNVTVLAIKDVGHKVVTDHCASPYLGMPHPCMVDKES